MDENTYTFEEALRELNGCDKESTLRNWIKEFGLLEGKPHLIKDYENGASAKRPGRKVLKITEAGIKRIQRFINWRRWALSKSVEQTILLLNSIDDEKSQDILDLLEGKKQEIMDTLEAELEAIDDEIDHLTKDKD